MELSEFFSRYYKFIVVSSLVLAAAFFVDQALGAALMLAMFLAAATLLVLKRRKDETFFLAILFLIVFLVHIMGVIFVYYTNFQPFSNGTGDYIEYNNVAKEVAARVHSENFSLSGLAIGHLYPVIVGYLYAFTVPSMLVGELLNAWVVAVIAIFVYLIIRHMGGSEKEGFWVGIIVCFYPSLAFYGSLLLKDALVILLSTVGLLLVLKLIRAFSLARFIIFYAVLLALIHFRFYIGYALIFTFLVSWFFFAQVAYKKRMAHGVIIFLLLGLAPLILGHGYYGLSDFKDFFNVKTISYYREVVYAPPPQVISNGSNGAGPSGGSSSTGTAHQAKDSSIVIKTNFNSPFAFLINDFLSFIFTLLGPFPWQLKQLKHLFVLPEVIAWFVLFYFIVRASIKSFSSHYKDTLPLIIFALLVVGVLSLFMTNFGITTRIRMPAFIALLCILPLGFKKFNIKLNQQ